MPLAIFRITAFIFWTLVMASLFLLASVFIKRKKNALLKRHHAGCCRIFNITVQTHGKISDKPKTIYVANHASYIDIPILGSVLEGQFVAKSDVANWPIIGHLAKLQNTLYVERRASQAKKQSAFLGEALSRGGNLIIFPEGTNTLGDEVKRFKSSLFGEEVMAQNPHIQPVAVAYSMPDGSRMSEAYRPFYGWPLEMGFFPHFVEMAKQKGMQADITFHNGFDCNASTDRKEILNTAQALVEKSVLRVIK